MEKLNQVKKRACILLLIVLIGMSILYLAIGDIHISLESLLQTLLLTGSKIDEFVVFRLRLPRLFIVLSSGAALALSGALLQGVTRNELADPGIIGINAGAGVGVTVFFLLFSYDAKSFSYLLPVAAFLGAGLTALLIFAFSYQRKTGIHPYKIILVGIGFSMALSGFMILLISSAERDEVQFISSWLAGNIWGGDWPFVLVIVPIILIAIILIFFKLQTLNILQLGEEAALGLGVSLQKVQVFYMVVATLLAASAVSVVGSIGFIGLMSPHIAKRLVGQQTQRYIPITLLLGSTILVVADFLAKQLVEPNGLPTGLLVAFIGAPYFLYLIVRNNH